MNKDKKKKVKFKYKQITAKVINYYEYLFTEKINYYKFANINSCYIGYLMNINKQFQFIMSIMNKNNLIENDYVLPSIIKAYNDDITIKPFWNNKIQSLSDKLFLPSTDNLIYSNGKSITLENSWFNVQECTGLQDKYYKLKIQDNNTSSKQITKCKQIKLFLSKEQRKYMQQIIGTYRYFYNRCVSYFNNYDKKTNKSWFYINPSDKTSRININIQGNPYNMINMRKQLKVNLPQWLLKDYPSHLIDQAFIEAFDRFNTCLNQSIKKGIPFEFKYKSKKESTHTINLEKQMLNSKTNGLFTNWKINGKYLFRKLKSSERFSKDIIGSSITYHKVLNTFIFNMNYKTHSNKCYNKEPCAIDQGIKNPFTIYSPTKVTIIGNNANEKIVKLCKEMDIIQSRMNKKAYYMNIKENGTIVNKEFVMNANRKRNLRKALHRKIKKIKDLRNELHHKTIRYICDNYKSVILPPFKTQEMVGRLTNKVSRQMCTLSFYKFKQKLMSKAEETGIKINSLSEPFTSKTCGKCGNIKYNLGNADIYNCDKCGLEIGRDINGARCILLRNLHRI